VGVEDRGKEGGAQRLVGDDQQTQQAGFKAAIQGESTTAQLPCRDTRDFWDAGLSLYSFS
jgi:hypothetical protein